MANLNNFVNKEYKLQGIEQVITNGKTTSVIIRLNDENWSFKIIISK